MPPQQANLTSTAAVSAMRAALVQFGDEVRETLVRLALEARRPLEWIEHDRSRYWPREARRASDAVSEARIALERCEMSIDQDEPRRCYDERKALEKAKRRQRLADEKIEAVRRWKLELQKEVEALQTQVAKLQHYLDADLAQAVAALARMTAAIDDYLRVAAPAESAPPASSAEPGP